MRRSHYTHERADFGVAALVEFDHSGDARFVRCRVNGPLVCACDRQLTQDQLRVVDVEYTRDVTLSVSAWQFSPRVSTFEHANVNVLRAFI